MVGFSVVFLVDVTAGLGQGADLQEEEAVL